MSRVKYEVVASIAEKVLVAMCFGEFAKTRPARKWKQSIGFLLYIFIGYCKRATFAAGLQLLALI